MTSARILRNSWGNFGTRITAHQITHRF